MTDSRSLHMKGIRWLVGLLALACILTPAAEAADYFDDAPHVRIGETYSSADIGAYTQEDGEDLTSSGAFICPEAGTEYLTYATDWTHVVGTGRQLTATIFTDWTSLIALYPTDITSSSLCNVDLSATQNQVVWSSTAGAGYRLQVGPCWDHPDNVQCDFAPTSYDLLVTSAPPANDLRANATPYGPGSGQQRFDNHGATVEGEGTPSCAVGADAQPFRSTVWFKFTADHFGTATFTATPTAGDFTDTVMAVYRGAETSQLGCNDTPSDAEGDAQVSVPVSRGETYFVQVGSWGPNGSLAAQGAFTYKVAFTTNDNDGDGAGNDGDCAPDDPTRRPGATDVFNNGIDEDCSGADDQDEDNDGHAFQPAGGDCDDKNPAIGPQAKEIKGNRTDENCDGKLPAARLSPSPDVQLFSALVPGRGRIFGDTRIAGVAKRYRITFKCTGRGCGKRRSKTIRVRKGKSVRTTWTTNAVLGRGARFEISVTLPGANRIGVYQRNGVTKTLKAKTRTCDLQPRTIDGRSFKRVRCSKG